MPPIKKKTTRLGKPEASIENPAAPLVVEEVVESTEVKETNAIPESTEESSFWKDEKAPEEPESEPQELGFLKERKKGDSSLSKLLLLTIAVALFVGALGGGILIFKEGFERGRKEVEVSPSPIAESTPSPTPELNRGDLTIQVLNGKGVPGTAKKVQDMLVDLGYEVANTANAKKFDHKDTEISIKDSKKDYFDILKKDLEKEYTVSETQGTLDEDSQYDAIVIIGSN